MIIIVMITILVGRVLCVTTEVDPLSTFYWQGVPRNDSNRSSLGWTGLACEFIGIDAGNN